MDKSVVFIIFLAVAIIGQRVLLKFLAKLSYSKFSDSDPEISNNVSEYWRNLGKRRDFENAEYELENEDFFENEVTETESLTEAFEGLSDDEIEMIAEEAGILDAAGGENE